TTYQYKYDAEGLRTRKESTGGTVRYHLDNNGRVIAESNAAGQVIAQNIWGHKALARKVSGAYYYYIYNGHGDVIQVLNSSGTIVNSYTYDEWGNVLNKTEQISNPIRYAGEYYDEESGLYYLRARYYDPSVGRFISEDSEEGNITNPLSLNPYMYCENDPINYLDYSGHNPAAVIYLYCATVTSSPDTQMDLQCIALDLSQGNYFAATFDAAGALIPGATGLGKTADNVAAKVLKFFGKKSREEIAAIKQTFGSGKVVMSYKYLKPIVKGTGLETHHLIEKRFAKILGINANEIMSIAIDPKLHDEITAAIRKEIGYSLDLSKKLRTTNATAQDIWDALEKVYTNKGMSIYLDSIRSVFEKKGVNTK
ncbi:MAG: RHS repeat-associated core domain-containing protein, partial [Dehalobacterium sp.]